MSLDFFIVKSGGGSLRDVLAMRMDEYLAWQWFALQQHRDELDDAGNPRGVDPEALEALRERGIKW